MDVPNLKVGKIGLEKKINQNLLGVPGSATYEVDAYGRRVKQIVKKIALMGLQSKLLLIKIYKYLLTNS